MQGTPRTPETASASAAAADSGGNAADGADADQRVFLQSTRHVARAWAVYGSLLPVFKRTADVPMQIMRAVQSLFEEFMLWTVVSVAGVTPTAVVRGVNGRDDRFFRVVWSLMLRSDRASRTRRYGQQLQAVVQAADKGDGKGDAGAARPADLQDGVGLGGGTLDRLVRGTIACDALATLAQDLLELESVLVCCDAVHAAVASACIVGHAVASVVTAGDMAAACTFQRVQCRLFAQRSVPSPPKGAAGLHVHICMRTALGTITTRMMLIGEFF